MGPMTTTIWEISTVCALMGLVSCGGGGGSDTSTPSASGAGSAGGSAPADYSTQFNEGETQEASFHLTASAPNHLDVNDSFTLTEQSIVWAFVAARYSANVYILDQTNAQAFVNHQAFRGYLLNPQGGGSITFPTLPAGTYWIGTVAGQSPVPAGYDNPVFHEVSFNQNLPNWVGNGNLPLSYAGGAGAWQEKGFTRPSGDWRAYIETEGYAGKFAVMTDAQFNDFHAKYANGYSGGGYGFVYACGGQSGQSATEIECELKLPPGTYHLVYINDTTGWAGGAANIQFYRPI